MRSVVLVLLLLTPPLLALIDNPAPSFEEHLEHNESVLSHALWWQPVGLGMGGKDELAGYVWIREIEALDDGTAYVAGIFAGGSTSAKSPCPQ